ncbi:hypothetical protein ACP3TD_19170 [Pseudarthrobacter sp. 1G09]|uniref:hypothetical protein n=1 Tax=Pseudarthrobacter sp. 1G09 TaxID=3416178 RepID=UPI003CED7C90
MPRTRAHLPVFRLAWLLVAAVLFTCAGPAWADPTNSPAGPQEGSSSQSLLGNDVSWPQCDAELPQDRAFAIVGVNNGLANNTNPCLQEQLEWAESSSGAVASQPKAQLYINTANPGRAGSWWPVSDEYPTGSKVHNPYGSCKAGDYGTACAYMYGYAKAFDAAYVRGVTDPEDYIWWLDVETENTWSSSKDANRTVLEGMTDFFHSIDAAGVGIYSTGQQWHRIVGSVSSSSNLYPLPSWLAGSRNAASAATACSKSPLTGGGKVVLTQFIHAGLDYNHACT